VHYVGQPAPRLDNDEAKVVFADLEFDGEDQAPEHLVLSREACAELQILIDRIERAPVGSNPLVYALLQRVRFHMLGEP
jgi:hypothetical protein